jgi:hypothetical protein
VHLERPVGQAEGHLRVAARHRVVRRRPAGAESALRSVPSSKSLTGASAPPGASPVGTAGPRCAAGGELPPPRAVHRHARLPDADDGARGRDVGRRIAVDEHEVGALSGRHATAVGEREGARRHRRRGAQRLDGCQPGLHEQLELQVHRRPVHRARVAGVGAGEDRHARRAQRADGRLGGGVAPRRRGAGDGEDLAEHLRVLAGEEGRDARVARERRAWRHAVGARADGAATRGGEHRERRDSEGATSLHQRREARVAGRVEHQVREAARAGVDGGARRAQIADVHDGQPVAPARGGDGRAQRRGVERGEAAAVEVPVVEDDLDPVGALGEPRVDERLRRVGGGERGDRHPVLGAVAARCGDERAGGEHVGARRGAPVALLRAPRRRLPVVGEHVQLGRHAEGERGARRVAPGMHVRVDEAGEERAPAPVDHRGTGRGDEAGRHLCDAAAGDEHVARRVHALPVEQAHLSEEHRRRVGARRLRVGRLGREHGDGAEQAGEADGREARARGGVERGRRGRHGERGRERGDRLTMERRDARRAPPRAPVTGGP